VTPIAPDPRTTRRDAPTARARAAGRANLATRAGVRLGTLRELFALLATNGLWWLAPIVVVLLLAGLLLLVVSAVEYVAPFVYTVF
jgi:hypothetical protein